MQTDDYTILIHKSLTGALSAEESAQLQQWLNENTQNKLEYDEIKEIWELYIDEDEALTDVDFPMNVTSLAGNLSILIEKDRLVKRLRRLAILTMAACFILMMVTGYLYYHLDQNIAPSYTVFSEEESTVWLSDSSRVNLGGNSYIVCRFGKRERIVNLQGEAIFSVTKDTRPFTVRSGAATVRVKSTTFHVRAFPNSPMEVTVINGLVEVSLSSKTWHLKKGQYISLEDGVNSQVKPTEQSNASYWLTGKLEFRKTQLHEVIRKIEKVYGIHCSVTPALQTCPFTGTFEHTPLPDVIKILSYSMDVEFQKTGEDSYTISGKGCIL